MSLCRRLSQYASHLVIWVANEQTARSKSNLAIRAPYSTFIRILAAIGCKTPSGAFGGFESVLSGAEVAGCKGVVSVLGSGVP